jgi:hypothetical protein
MCKADFTLHIHDTTEQVSSLVPGLERTPGIQQVMCSKSRNLFEKLVFVFVFFSFLVRHKIEQDLGSRYYRVGRFIHEGGTMV